MIMNARMVIVEAVHLGRESAMEAAVDSGVLRSVHIHADVPVDAIARRVVGDDVHGAVLDAVFTALGTP